MTRIRTQLRLAPPKGETQPIIERGPISLPKDRNDHDHILAGMISAATQENYARHLAAYLSFAGDQARFFDPTTLVEWRQYLYTEGYTKNGEHRAYSVSAINNRLSAVRRVMEEAAQLGYISAETNLRFDAVRGLTLNSNPERRNWNAVVGLTNDAVTGFLTAIPTHTAAGMMHRALFSTLAESGMRVSECATLRSQQLERRQIDTAVGWVITGLSRKFHRDNPNMVITIGKTAKAAIDVWLARRQAIGVVSEYVFTSFAGRGDRATAKPISRQGIYYLTQYYADEIEVEHVTTHSFRRWCLTMLAHDNLKTAQVQAGHVNIQTTSRYVANTVALGSTDLLSRL